MNRGQRIACTTSFFVCAALTAWPPWLEERQFSIWNLDVVTYVSIHLGWYGHHPRWEQSSYPSPLASTTNPARVCTTE